jgi:hypothetical protein
LDIYIRVLNKEHKENESIYKQEEKKNNNIFSYKQLALFKDKSMLFISDIEREQNIDQESQNIIKIFKKYVHFFSIVEEIYLLSQELIRYGLDPNSIKCVIKINGGDFSKLETKRNELKVLFKSWIDGIKEIYQQSYVLTHFIGPELSKFINYCLNCEYHPSLERIIGLSKNTFDKEIGDENFMDLILKANNNS